MLLKIFVPVMVKAPAPPWLRVQSTVEPPPTNVFADALVRLIVPVPVPAVVVNPVGTALLKAVVPEATTTNVPPLNVRFLVPAAVRNVAVAVADSVSVLPSRFNVPLVSVTAPAKARLVVNASCSVTVPAGELIVKPCVNVFPAAVIVCVVRPPNVICPVPDNVVPVPLIQLP